MKLCSHNDHHLSTLLQHFKKDYTDKESSLLDLGNILKNVDKWDDAEKYHRRFTHPNVIQIKQNIRRISSKLK
jgi:hypothetical protein